MYRFWFALMIAGALAIIGLALWGLIEIFGWFAILIVVFIGTALYDAVMGKKFSPGFGGDGGGDGGGE